MKRNVLLAVVAFASVLPTCAGGPSDLAVVSKELKKEANVSTAGGSDLGMSIPSSGSYYWVEGKLKNGGKDEAKAVTIAFRVTDGNSKLVLTAEVPTVPPGTTVSFRTPTQASRLTLRLVEEEPEIRAGR